ncbi:MAG TPA: AsmA family protein, partial [Rhodopila sp.]
AVAIGRFNPNAYKPDIVAAVKRATGRDLALNGEIGLKASLWPTIQANDVSFANPPGFSRPQMASLQGVELQLGLLPLLSRRIDIERLVLIKPDILLETDTAGHPNWQMTPEVSPSAPAGSQAPVQSPGGTRTEVSVASIRIQDGKLAYRDDRTGKITTLGLPRLEATASSPDSPLHLDADAAYNGTGFTLAGDTGSLTRLQDPAATAPWPVKLTLAVGTTKLSADGSLTQPLQGKGYDLAVKGTVPDAAALAPLLQGFVPPPLHDVSFAAKVTDTGGSLPVVSALTLHVGPSDLSAEVHGLTLDHLDLAAAAADQPVKADAAGKLGDQPVSFAATTGPLSGLLSGAKPAPFPVDATFKAAGASVSAKGSIADVTAMTGANLALAAQIPDLSALSPLARRAMPAIKQIAFHGTLTDAAGGFRDGAALHGLSLTSTDGDLSGDAAIGLAPRTNVTAKLQSNRLDLDALQAALDQMPAAPPQTPTSAPEPPPAPPKHSQRLFSDQPIPFDLLRVADADLALSIADLRSGGANYKSIATHAVLKDGKLAVDPFAADLPGGHLAGSASADATQPAPPVRVVLRAPGLALKTVLAAAHEPSYASGNLEVYADLHGAGDSPHAIAATLDGYLGLAVAQGTIDNRLLGSLLGKVMNTLNALNLVGKGGDSELKCFGLRMDAAHGIGTIKPLAISSSLLTMTGAGTINLGEESLSLTLAPQARVAGTGVVIPLTVVGPIRDPAVKVNEAGAVEKNAGTVAGAVIGNATPLGIVGGLLGGDKVFGGKTDICPAALAAARGQAAPEGAKSEATKSEGAKSGAAKPAEVNPGALLKNLLR